MTAYQRFKYKKCPLVEVIYQINFPAILAIEGLEPIDFQERIRGQYPVYSLQIEQQNEVVVNVQNAKADATLNQQQMRKLHHFISEDQQWRVTLAKDMLALSTVDYSTWEVMTARAVEAVKALIECYKPGYFSRLGLRYVDAIERPVLGLQDVPWDSLLKPHICGCLCYKSDGLNQIRNNNVSSEIVIDDININIASGLGTVDHHDGNAPSEAFILNCDYYISQRIDITDLAAIAARLHQRSHLFFRDSITEKLHNAMEPERMQDGQG